MSILQNQFYNNSIKHYGIIDWCEIYSDVMQISNGIFGKFVMCESQCRKDHLKNGFCCEVIYYLWQSLTKTNENVIQMGATVGFEKQMIRFSW